MSVVVVPADPPRDGLVLPRLPETSPLAPSDATALYEALLQDVVVAAVESGGDLLVNYRPDELLPADHRGDESAEAGVRATVASAVDLDAVRFETQAGSSYSARVGNTVTHLLEQEDATAVLVVDPTAALTGRRVVDSAGIKARRRDVVLGPAPGGRLHLAGFAEPIDFTDAFATPALETATARARDVGHEVDFVELAPIVETGADLATVVSLVRARADAGRIVPEYTRATIEELGLSVVEEDGDAAIVGGTEGS